MSLDAGIAEFVFGDRLGNSISYFRIAAADPAMVSIGLITSVESPGWLKSPTFDILNTCRSG